MPMECWFVTAGERSSYSSFPKIPWCLPFPSSTCAYRATVCDCGTLHGCENIVSISWPAQARFETAAWIASWCTWLGLALAMLKLNCFSTLNDLFCLWPGFCARWASTTLHSEVAPSPCCAEHQVCLSRWFLVKPETQPGSCRMEGAVINVSS